MLYDLIYMWNLQNNSQKTPHRMREQIGCQGHRVGGGRRGGEGSQKVQTYSYKFCGYKYSIVTIVNTVLYI